MLKKKQQPKKQLIGTSSHYRPLRQNWAELKWAVEANQPEPSSKKPNYGTAGAAASNCLNFNIEWGERFHLPLIAPVWSLHLEAAQLQRQAAGRRQQDDRWAAVFWGFLSFSIFFYYLFQSFNFTWQKVCIQGLRHSQSLSPVNQ